MLFKTIINPDFVLYVNKKSNYVCVNFYKFYHSGLFKKSRLIILFLILLFWFICNLYIFPLISLSDIVSITKLTDTENYWSVWHQTYDDFTDKNNSFEGFNIHYHYYHNSFYQTHCDANDDVCLGLHNCRYSIYLYILIILCYQVMILLDIPKGKGYNISCFLHPLDNNICLCIWNNDSFEGRDRCYH